MSEETSSHSSSATDEFLPLAVQTAEEHRWLAWLGTPAALAAVFTAISFGTGKPWILTFTVVVIIADIFVLIMLALTTDTNGAVADAHAGHKAT